MTSSQDFVHLYLDKILEQKRVPHLLLFSGEAVSGMRPVAQDFARAYLIQKTGKRLSSFQDIMTLSPEGKLGLHSVDSIRQLIHFLSLSPFEAAGKVAIIESAERMLPTSANLLLKTIEEPSPNTLIMLLSDSPKRLLGTIRSRCQEVRFAKTTKNENPFEMEVEALFSAKRAFFELSDFADSMQKKFDKRKKELQDTFLEDAQKSYQDMSAAQKEQIQEEVDGATSLAIHDEVSLLFSAIALSLKKRNPLDFDRVAESLSFASLSLERSAPLKSVLESFFLQLQLC